MAIQSQHPGGIMPRGWRTPQVTVNVLIACGLAIAILLLAMSAASQAIAPQTTAGTLNLTESDAGRLVFLNTGQMLAVSLSGNPTTGYQWLLDPASETILKPVGAPAYTPDSTLIGAGGTTTWRFSAVAAGQAPLRFTYRRAWEQDTPPLRTFEITVEVQ